MFINQQKAVISQKNGALGGKDFNPGNPGNTVSLNLTGIADGRRVSGVYATDQQVTGS